MTIPMTAPSGLIIISKTISSVKIQWNLLSANSDTGYNSINRYKIYLNSGSGYVFNSFQTDPTNNTYEITGLTLGQTYSFTVSAFNDIGEGPINSVGVSTLVANAPLSPSSLGVSLSGTNVVIAWNAPDNQGQSILQYNIRFLSQSIYSTDLILCNGTSSTVITGTSCTSSMALVMQRLGLSAGD